MKRFGWAALVGTLALVMTPYAFHLGAASPTDLEQTLVTQNPIVLDSPLFTRYEETTPYTQPVVDMSEFELLMENDQVKLYYNPLGLALRVENKVTGYIWATDVPNIGDYTLNAINRRRIRSSAIVNIRDSDSRADTLAVADNGVLTSKVNLDADTVRFTVDMAESDGVYFFYDISLTDEGFRLDFDTDSIQETLGARVIDISFFPFMGAVNKDDIPGYAFIPSGNGGLVRFEESATMSAPFVERMYGPDIAQVINYTGNFGFNFPVYGIVHGEEQDALFVHIDKGSEMSVFRYTPTGTSTDFHTVGMTFLIREPYTINITGNDPIFEIPANKYVYDVGMEISVLEDESADYIGMAERYREILQANGLLPTTRINRDDLSMQLSILGGDTEKGLFTDSLIKMTTTQDVLAINERLADEGITNLNYLLRGFNSNGMTDHSYRNYLFSGQFGSLNDLQELDYSLLYNPTELIVDNGRAPNTALENIAKYFLSQQIDRDYSSYFMNVNTMNNAAPTALSKLAEQGGATLAGVNSLLYSDPYAGYTRSEVIELIQGWTSDRISMYRATEYLLGQTSEIMQLDLYHTRQKFLTDSVPFLQYVFQGYITNYSPYLNYSSNHEIDVLKVIEYNTQPSFLVTAQPSYLLSETTSRNMYASYYDTLHESIVEDYEFIQTALDPVLNALVIDREVLAKGVTRVDYDNDISMYFNYTPNAVTVEGVTIAPMNYSIKEVSNG